MPRTLTAGVLTEIAAVNADLVHFIELNFSGGAIRLTTAPDDMVWNTYTWVGIGGNVGFGAALETTDDQGQGVELTLSGVEQSIISAALGQNYVGRVAKVYRVHLLNGAIVDAPFMIFSGLMNSGFEIEEQVESDPPTVTIRSRMTGRLSVFDQERGFRTNVQTHQAIYNGDTFFQNVGQIPGRKIYWGIPTAPGFVPHDQPPPWA